jgi:Gas vesicle synthesis protein GvpL/GvpF
VTAEDRTYYLYCLAPSGRALELQEADVFVWPCDDISAVLSEANREEFCGEGSDARLGDLAWLAPRVFRHEAVVEQVMVQSPVLPARFATLFSSRDSLQSFIVQHRDAITGYFAHLGDKREWAVKGLLGRPVAGQSAEAPPAATPGKNYLQKKRSEVQAGELTNQWLRATCEKAAGELERHSSAFRERQLWSGSESGAASEVILNWAFLLAGGAEADFRQSVADLDERHRERGLSFALSGPWPPYSFAPVLDVEGTS